MSDDEKTPPGLRILLPEDVADAPLSPSAKMEMQVAVARIDGWREPGENHSPSPWSTRTVGRR